MLQYFNTSWQDLTVKIPELAEVGYESLWLPPPTKGSGGLSVGYDLWDRFDLGSKDQRGNYWSDQLAYDLDGDGKISKEDLLGALKLTVVIGEEGTETELDEQGLPHLPIRKTYVTSQINTAQSQPTLQAD